MEQLHLLKMRSDEDIRGYQDRVEVLVSKVRSLGKKEEVSNEWVAKRVLRTVTRKYEPKVFVLEEREDTPTSEQVFDILYHFESKLNQEDEPSAKEAAFKTISKHDKRARHTPATILMMKNFKTSSLEIFLEARVGIKVSFR